MTSQADKAAAEAEAASTAAEGSGAGDSQPDNAEVNRLQTLLDAANVTIQTHVDEAEAAAKTIEELTAANKKFADDATSSADMAKQLADAQTALEESRKTSADLLAQVETANTTNKALQDRMTSARRDTLVSRYGLNAEKVAALDDAGLAALESTLPDLQLANQNGNNSPGGSGYGLDAGSAGTPDVSSLTESERSLRAVERLKNPS